MSRGRLPTILAWLIVIAAVAGCGAKREFPQMRLQELNTPAQESDEIAVPEKGAVTSREIDAELLRELPARKFASAAWATVPRDSFDAAKVTAMEVIRKQPARGPSPYSKGYVDLFSRIILKASDGSYYYTRRLDSTAATPEQISAKHVGLSQFDLSSSHGQLTGQGRLTTEPIDPLKVAATGYCAAVRLRNTSFVEEFAVPADFSELEELTFNARDGRPSAPGDDAQAGQAGTRGSHGRDGAAGAEPTSAGGDGGAGQSGYGGQPGGSGRNGLPGGNVGRGEDGASAAKLQVRATPLLSPFADRPLVHLTVTAGGKTWNYVSAWGQKLVLQACGGNGGNGGRGGRGGSGGGGGIGGDGGRGGNGGPGAPGKRGARGLAGTDATRDLDAGPGMQGFDGGDGGDGGEAGDGGSAGDGGDGGNGADGGIGGDAGNGGAGAQIDVIVDGDAAFTAMLKTAIAFDVNGGNPGEPGEAGAAGLGGKGGQPGSPGAGGTGGKPGDGGRGGPGGTGGAGCEWITERVNEAGQIIAEQHSRPAADDGKPGHAGDSGTPGKHGADGKPGRSGRDGLHGDQGARGKPGLPGPKGTVNWVQPDDLCDIDCDLRIARVADASLVASASAKGRSTKLDALAAQLLDSLKATLKEDSRARPLTIAVTGLRNRTGTPQAKAVIDALIDKLTNVMIASDSFDAKERVDLSALVDEKDLEIAEIVSRTNVKEKLAGVRFVVVGGVTVRKMRKEE